MPAARAGVGRKPVGKASASKAAPAAASVKANGGSAGAPPRKNSGHNTGGKSASSSRRLSASDAPPARVKVSDLDHAFDEHSLDVGSGKLLQEDLVGEAMRSMGFNPSETQIYKFCNAQGKDGFVTKNSLEDFTRKQDFSKYSLSQLTEMFHAFDVKKTGVLEAKDFRTIFNGPQAPIKLSDNEIEEMMYIADNRMDGKVDLPDFLALMAPDLVGGRTAKIDTSAADEYLRSMAADASARGYEAMHKAKNRQGELSAWNDRLAAADANLCKAKSDVTKGCVEPEAWIEVQGQSPCAPLSEAGMRKILTAKLGAACMTAENEVQGFQDFEESHLADQRKQREVKPAPLQYSDAHAKNKDELRKLYQLMRFFEAQTNVTPPGLFDVEFASKGWDDAAEKKLRAELRECYLGGMAGKPLSRGYNTADHRAAHSLGFARRYNGSVLATAQTSLAFTSAAGFQAESSLFEGPSVEEMLPCPKDADRTEVRSCATYTGMNEGLQTSEESADADPEDLCRQSGYTANAGAAYYKQPHSAVAGGMLHDGKDSKVTFTQLLSKEGAYIQDCYSAGLSDSPMPPAPTDVPGVDPAILQWKGKYAYAVGLSHRKDVMNSCPVDKTNERGELYVPNSYVQNIERSMTAEKNANGDDLLKLKGFGALLQEMDQVYGALSLELKSGEQALEKEADALRKLNQGYAQWLADKPARDKAARESLEAEEQRKRNEIEQESRTSMGTIQSSFNSSKPRAVPKPVAPKPQPKKPVEAKKKGCCG